MAMPDSIPLDGLYEQLERRARHLGVSLKRACAAEGIAESTFRRWRDGSTSPREEVAVRVWARLDAMARQAVMLSGTAAAE